MAPRSACPGPDDPGRASLHSLRNLSGLAAPSADSATIPAARLEHCRQVDRQGTAAAGRTAGARRDTAPLRQPRRSIADKWIAKELLRQGAPPALVETLLRCGSPGFPRRHAAPTDYLRRTLARALGELSGAAFPAPAPSAHCVAELWPPPSPGHTSSSEIHVGPPADCGGRTPT